MAKKNYYKILGVEKQANSDEIKNAYKKLAIKYHPDRQAGKSEAEKSEAEDKFKEATEAYSILSDENKRQQYDQLEFNNSNMASGFGGFDTNDILNSVFGSEFNFKGYQKVRRGSDIRLKVKLNQQEMVCGVTKKFKVLKDCTCPHCKGTGAEGNAMPEICGVCHGRGYILRSQHHLSSMMQSQSSCPECHGEGKVIRNKCTYCYGTGIVKDEDIIEVQIPAGVHDGMVINVPSKGNAGAHNGVNGDILLLITKEQDDTFVKYLDITKKSVTGLNRFEKILLAAILALTVIGFLIKGEVTLNTAIAAIAAILGVFCVVLGAKGSIANWIFGTVEAFLHIYICFCTHIYGDMLQRIVYNLPMQFVGWKKWKKRMRDDDSQTIHTRYMTWEQRLLTVFAVSLGTFFLGVFLIYFGPWMIDTMQGILPDMQFKTLKMDYDHPMQLWLDSFTTVMSIITMYVSVKAFVEQWYMWLTINIAYITMWLMSDSDFSFMTVAKYSVYLINSFYGIYMWNKLSKD